MAQRFNNNRGRSSSRGSDQPLMNNWSDTARERPMATAAAAAGAVAAGVFLWSRRNQISDQINRLSDQITGWAEDMRSGSSSRELAMTEGPNESSAIESSRKTASRGGKSSSRATGKRSTASRGSAASPARAMSETGAGNASLGAHSGTTGGGGTIGGGPRA